MLSNLLEQITIDRRSRVEYKIQIKESIKSLILDQSFYYQTKLPNSLELANHLNLEESIIKSAYAELCVERYIQKDNDNDWIVSYFELTNYFFDRNVAVYDAIKALGLKPSIKCLEKKIVVLDKEVINKMGFDITQANKYFYINRIYLGDNQPIMLLENFLPLYIFPEISENFIGNEPLDAYISKNYGIKAEISKRIIKSVNLTADIAKILNERKNAASIQSTNKIYDKNQRLIDYGTSHTICSYYFQALISRDEMNQILNV